MMKGEFQVQCTAQISADRLATSRDQGVDISIDTHCNVDISIDTYCRAVDISTGRCAVDISTSSWAVTAHMRRYQYVTDHEPHVRLRLIQLE